MNIRRKRLLVAGVGFSILLIGSTATASIPSADGTIHACIQPQNGNVTKIIDVEAGQSCAANEQPLIWNRTGPQGPAGATGPTGPQGPAGPQGPPGTLPKPVWVYATVQTSVTEHLWVDVSGIDKLQVRGQFDSWTLGMATQDGNSGPLRVHGETYTTEGEALAALENLVADISAANGSRWVKLWHPEVLPTQQTIISYEQLDGADFELPSLRTGRLTANPDTWVVVVNGGRLDGEPFATQAEADAAALALIAGDTIL